MKPAEETAIHTRILRVTLAVEESRAYWSHVDPDDSRPRSDLAFSDWWFGSKTPARIQILLANFRVRYDAFPEALEVLRGWSTMPADVRPLVCHWHLQLSDPLYREFTGRFLPERRLTKGDVHRDTVQGWVHDKGEGRWNGSTEEQFASKLLSSALSAGLIDGSRDPRPLLVPRVSDLALGYALHLLRGVGFAGTLLDNPYLASVGLPSADLEPRLRRLPGVRFGRMGELTDLSWDHADLHAWAAANGLLTPPLKASA